MDKMEIFKFKEAQVRTVIQNNEPWFVAKDVCEFFGDTNYRRSIGRIDEDEKGVCHKSPPLAEFNQCPRSMKLVFIRYFFSFNRKKVLSFPKKIEMKKLKN